MARFARRLAPFVLLLAPALAHAQEPLENVWARSTALGAVIGGAADSVKTGPVLGGTAGWEVTRWIGLEGRGLWFGRGSGADGFGADISALVNVVPRQTITPFVVAGVGLYRASFDSSAAPMGSFYRRRMSGVAGPGSSQTFTDPTLRLGGGVDLLARRNVAVRPEVSVLLIRRNGNTATLTTFGVQLAYRFEDHPVTPSSR